MSSKEEFMDEAIFEARRAYSLKETPIGAVIVYDNKIVGRGYNSVELKNNATCHAELMAIREAAKNIGNWRLIDCEMYVTMQPCFMCSGAIVNSRIKKLYVGVKHSKNEVVDKHNSFSLEFLRDNKVEVDFGIREDICSSILTKFFKERRKSKKK